MLLQLRRPSAGAQKHAKHTHEPAGIGRAPRRNGLWSVEERSQMTIHSWRLIRTPAGTFHLVALMDPSTERETVHVTSPIIAVDGDGRIVTTSSGDEYELIGPPEERERERDVLLSGVLELGMGEAVDVSVLAWDLVQLN